GILSELGESWHSEAFDYVRRMTTALGPDSYLRFVEDAKREAGIPVIASLNCTSPGQWSDYAERIAGAGADAIELNLSLMPSGPEESSLEVEDRYLRVVGGVRARVEIPLAVKIGPHFTAMTRMATRFADQGASALVLFNRFLQLDVDPERIEIVPGSRFSSPKDAYTSLRWVSLLYGRVPCDLAAATGVHDGQGIVKLVLAGAAVVQIASAIYLHGFGHLGEMLSTVEKWLASKGFSSLDDVRGRLSQAQSPNPDAYERFQYIKAVSGLE
ncbi:MAG: dihydroorotate dehydrogenase-like protein, partial [Candidatus Eisenbacteria bacterium]|nr:dihydroorotate dehydrogenase-like protein [Candidatus Eisenbacteria bacterium]